MWGSNSRGLGYVEYLCIAITLNPTLAHSAKAAEYTNCMSVEGLDFPKECPRYDTKQSDGMASVMREVLGNAEYPFIAIASGSTLAWSDNPW